MASHSLIPRANNHQKLWGPSWGPHQHLGGLPRRGPGGFAEFRSSALPHFSPRDLQGVGRAFLRRPALPPTALLRLR